MKDLRREAKRLARKLEGLERDYKRAGEARGRYEPGSYMRGCTDATAQAIADDIRTTEAELASVEAQLEAQGAAA